MTNLPCASSHCMPLNITGHLRYLQCFALQVFDVLSLDMIVMMKLPRVLGRIRHIYKQPSTVPLQVFDVLSFDMIVMMKLPFVPGCAEWCFRRGDARAKLAVSDLNSHRIHVYDVRSGSTEPLDTVEVRQPHLRAALCSIVVDDCIFRTWIGHRLLFLRQ